MEVRIKAHIMFVSDDAAKMMYSVEYTAKDGDGYSCGDLWATFGVYNDEETAEFVRSSIVCGDIHPLCK